MKKRVTKKAATKKKALSLTTGPPSEAPNWLIRKGCFAGAGVVAVRRMLLA